MKKQFKTVIFWLVLIPIAFVWDLFFFFAQQFYFLLKFIDQLGEQFLEKIENWYKQQ